MFIIFDESLIVSPIEHQPVLISLLIHRLNNVSFKGSLDDKKKRSLQGVAY